MSRRTWRASVLAIGVLMVCGGLLRAQPLHIPASEAAGPPATVSGTGLNGAWFFDPDNPTQTFNNIATAQAYTQVLAPTGTFNASLLFWNGGDLTDINAFLNSEFGHDAKTLTPGASTPIRSSIFDMTGYINITAADLDTTFAVNSDDGSAMYIGLPGTYDYTVVLDDGTHGAVQVSQEVIFEAPGLYPIEVIYFNQDYNNGTGGAVFSFLSTLDNGGIVSGSRLYNAIPAP